MEVTDVSIISGEQLANKTQDAERRSLTEMRPAVAGCNVVQLADCLAFIQDVVLNVGSFAEQFCQSSQSTECKPTSLPEGSHTELLRT